MSFTIVEQAEPRLNRSELAVPGSRPELFEKAAKSAVDVIFLDLEDAVAPDDKPRARKNIIEGLNDIDWGTKTVSLRINGLDTHYMYRDVVDVVEACPRLDLIMIPKAGTAADIYAIDMLVTQIEDAMGRPRKIGFEMIIETALGMANVHEIAGASKRNESLHFGVADYAASTKAKTTGIGGPNPGYGVLTAWLSPPARMVCAPSTGRSATSPTRTATRPRPAAPRCSAARANGRSIPARSALPTRFSAPPRRRLRRRNESWRPWIRPRRRARAPSRWTAG